MRVALLQTSIADYRDKFIDLALREPGVELQIFVGDEYFEASTKTSEHVRKQRATQRVKNIFFAGRRLCLQVLPFFQLLKQDVVVYELNPRLLSNWPLLVVRRILGKRNVLWGHAWSRSGSGSSTEPLRHLMRLLADGLIFYTNEQRCQFIDRYEGYSIDRCSVAPNSLYSVNDIDSVEGRRDSLIYVGRLVKAKKVDLLVKAFSSVSNLLDGSTNLIIVGDGPERETLVSMAASAGILDRVEFKGHVSDLDELRKLYSRSLVSISPGYVGLSITQSFAFGVPMIVADVEPHSPELEAFSQDENGLYFTSDCVADLEDKIRTVFENSSFWINESSRIAADCRERYSVEKMVEGFYAACRVE